MPVQQQNVMYMLQAAQPYSLLRATTRTGLACSTLCATSQLVPASHLPHTGFLWVQEQASDIIDCNDVSTSILVMAWEQVRASDIVCEQSLP